jgi:hypothetical protein
LVLTSIKFSKKRVVAAANYTLASYEDGQRHHLAAPAKVFVKLFRIAQKNSRTCDVWKPFWKARITQQRAAIAIGYQIYSQTALSLSRGLISNWYRTKSEQSSQQEQEFSQ